MAYHSSHLQVPQQILRPCERYHGRVELKMTYSTEKELFTVHVFGAKQLLNFGTRGVTCNPFVKWYAGPLCLYNILPYSCVLLVNLISTVMHSINA